MKQISYGKQRKAENSTPQIEIMTSGIFDAPIHRRKQMKGFCDMSKNDHHQRSRAEEL